MNRRKTGSPIITPDDEADVPDGSPIPAYGTGRRVTESAQSGRTTQAQLDARVASARQAAGLNADGSTPSTSSSSSRTLTESIVLDEGSYLPGSPYPVGYGVADAGGAGAFYEEDMMSIEQESTGIPPIVLALAAGLGALYLWSR